MAQCGVLYIAFGEQYRREALESIASLRRFTLNYHVVLSQNQMWTIYHPT